jgi:hypothetical protein
MTLYLWAVRWHNHSLAHKASKLVALDHDFHPSLSEQLLFFRPCIQTRSGLGIWLCPTIILNTPLGSQLSGCCVYSDSNSTNSVDWGTALSSSAEAGQLRAQGDTYSIGWVTVWSALGRSPHPILYGTFRWPAGINRHWVHVADRICAGGVGSGRSHPSCVLTTAHLDIMHYVSALI